MKQPAEGSGFQIGRIFGIAIYLHASWLIIFALIALTLRGYFQSLHPTWTPQQLWILGIATSVMFFVSLVFHELSHSMVARHYKIPVQSITLFVFGGLARIGREPDNAKQEVNIAIAGPLSSLFLGGCFWLIWRYVHGSEMVTSAASYLWWINVVLALFNLVPGFPLDGGRILRGIAWGITKNFTRATQIATTAGKVFGYAMILYGVWRAVNGNLFGGLWIAFIGWFLLSASQESFVQVAIRNTLTGVRAADIMTSDVPTVTRDMSIEEYVAEVLRTGKRAHIVIGAGTPVGLITLQAASSMPRDEWTTNSIQAVMLPLGQIHSATPDEPALGVLERMQNEDINQMPVISDGSIVGMIARDTILKVLQTRLQVGHLARQ
ncbi:MAG: site-2 protease family protein [Candidatus Acidiferrales bacterium]